MNWLENNQSMQKDLSLYERVKLSTSDIPQPYKNASVNFRMEQLFAAVAEKFISISPQGKQRSSPYSLAKAIVKCRCEGEACRGKLTLPNSRWEISRHGRASFTIFISIPAPRVVDSYTCSLFGRYHYSARALADLDRAIPLISNFLDEMRIQYELERKVQMIEDITKKARKNTW